MLNKRKIINDPVYGFIDIHFDIIYDLIEHPYFQRLRRIQQLGLTNYVYPAANHSRMQHALGSMHLMGQAIAVLKTKGIEISDEEAEASHIAILLHDIGHGPFSHALERSIVNGISHETLSHLFMLELNRQFNGKLDMAIEIFLHKYPKKFLNQLVSSQLDMDRLDYLGRDSFFTGVHEGIIGSDRIIKMLTVKDDELVVEEKGIYSIENFLLARRLMYWQVYLHKTVISAENLLLNILKRIKHLSTLGIKVFTTPYMEFFLNNELEILKYVNSINPDERKMLLDNFSMLEDNDIIASAKVWTTHPDRTLSILSQNLITRKLYKIELQNKPFGKGLIDCYKQKIGKTLEISDDDLPFFIFSGEISINAYTTDDDQIKILLKSGNTVDITEASDILNQNVFDRTFKKHFLCYPKGITF
jgi:uncharacterized protein